MSQTEKIRRCERLATFNMVFWGKGGGKGKSWDATNHGGKVGKGGSWNDNSYGGGYNSNGGGYNSYGGKGGGGGYNSYGGSGKGQSQLASEVSSLKWMMEQKEWAE